MRNHALACLLPVSFLFLGLPLAAADTPAVARFSFLLSGKAAGSETVGRAADGAWEAHFAFSDRGRGADETLRYRLGPGGVPSELTISGHDYFKNPVAESFALAVGKARWKSASEAGEVPAPTAAAFYIPLEGVPEISAVLARALLAAPGGKLALLPVGEAVIERLGTAEVHAGGRARKVQGVTITGLGFAPSPLWLDEDGTFFAATDGWSTTVREGWEEALPELTKIQQAAQEKQEAALAARLAHTAKTLVITGARLFDSLAGTSRPGTTVVVVGERIEAVGADGSVAIPTDALVIDAKGRALLPGLADLHTHLTPGDGLLNMAAGITTVRDLANDIDQLTALKARWDSGKAIGPRVLRAGFLDGPGPYAGPTKVLVATVAEAEAAIDRYAALGYEQIKVYSSIDPKLVPAILARAHAKGLRVSGHIPAFMTAEQAVRLGFDEIQHANFLFLNFLDVPDTRTPARFSEVAQHAAELDLSSEKVGAFLRLLKEKGVAVDPTVNVFEEMFTARPGQVSPSLAAVLDRLPPQVRRAVQAGGGGLPVPPGMDGRYRDSWQAVLKMVKALYDQGITLEAGTDALGGFGLHRELELYVQAGIPAAEVLKIATSGAARVTRHDDRGVIAPGKLADLILIDGDPATRISDIRRIVLTIKGGTVYDAGELYRALGVKPAV